jgi:Fe-Mn family superoxide dismutase
MFYRNTLSYGLNSLEPFIDAKTMNEHYNVHYKKYTDQLNEAIQEENISEESIQDILKNYKKYSKKVRNNGGGYYNHFLYFENISPYHRDYQTYASPLLKSLITQEYGSYEQFKNDFTNVGLGVFGSGWVWLMYKDNHLLIGSTANQDNPIMSFDCKVLLGMDVWEHAYYLKHMADRKSYINDFFNTIDWKIVSERI